MLAVILLSVSLILTILLIKKKKSMELHGDRKKIFYHFLKSSLEFFIPLTVVLAFYGVIILSVTISSEYISLQKLISLEQFFENIKKYFSAIKLSAIGVFVVLLIVFLLGMLKTSLQVSERFYRYFDKYQLVVRRTYIVIVLLCSFTLFGNFMGEPTKNLRIKIKTIREGYAEICKGMYDAITAEAADKIYPKVKHGFPPAYQKGLGLPQEIESQRKSLNATYEAASKEYGSSYGGRSVDNLLLAKKGVDKVTKTNIEIPEQKAVYYDCCKKSIPLQVSANEIKRSKSSVERNQKNFRERVIIFLNIESGKRLTLQVAKIFTSRLKTELFASWFRTYPIVEPIVNVFFDTMNKGIQTKMEGMIDKATLSVIQNPGNFQKTVTQEASNLVSQTKIEISPDNLAKAHGTVRQLEDELGKIQEARGQVEQAFKKAQGKEIDKSIAELGSSKESVREKAARRLAGIGEKLDKSQVNRLVHLARHGKQKWSRFLYREQHCSWYEYTSVKYYAADALENMKSPYVNRELTQEARRVKNANKYTRRVDDPGWV